jgi:hypothetical protein
VSRGCGSGAKPRDWLWELGLKHHLSCFPSITSSISRSELVWLLSRFDAMPLPTWPFYALIPTFILIHLFVSPYTKVEESFNIQAIHDILIHGIPSNNANQFLTANYDHASYPGSVPRTFAGALVLSGLSRPFIWLMQDTAQIQLLGTDTARNVMIDWRLMNSYSQRHFGSSQRRRTHRVWAKRTEGFRNQCWHLVCIIPGQPVPRHILCVSDAAKYVRVYFQ